jgi:hypothetical protein
MTRGAGGVRWCLGCCARHQPAVVLEEEAAQRKCTSPMARARPLRWEAVPHGKQAARCEQVANMAVAEAKS